MTKTTTLPITQALKNPAVSILPADTTVAKTVYTVGANDAVVKAIAITSTDSAAMKVQFILYDGVNSFVIGTVPVAALSGTDGIALAVDGLWSTYLPWLQFDQNNKRVLPLANGMVLKARVLTTVTAAKEIDIALVVEEF